MLLINELFERFFKMKIIWYILLVTFCLAMQADAAGRKIDVRGKKYSGVHHSRSGLVQGKQKERNDYEKRHSGSTVVRARGQAPYVR